MSRAKNRLKSFFFVILIVSCPVCPASSGWSEDLSIQVQEPIRQSIQIRQKTQQSTDQWAEERTRLETRFKALQEEQQKLLSAKNDLNEKVALQRTGLEKLKNKAKEVSRISDELLPYLQSIHRQMANQVDGDLPFLCDERRDRLQKVKEVLDDDRVPISEKFRRLMEVLFVEAEYGNTVEVYKEKISVDGKDILADIFRLGRLSLFFRSLDQTNTGYYDLSHSSWQIFPGNFNKTINTAIEIGAKRRPADLVTLPVGRIVVR
jgi:hypothetical protein